MDELLLLTLDYLFVGIFKPAFDIGYLEFSCLRAGLNLRMI